MAQGFSTGDLCFATQVEALDAYYSVLNPLAVSISISATQFHAFVKTGSTWNIATYNVTVSNGVFVLRSNTPAPTNVLGVCTIQNNRSENFQDGMTLGWAVAAAMVAVYVIRRVYR